MSLLPHVGLRWLGLGWGRDRARHYRSTDFSAATRSAFHFQQIFTDALKHYPEFLQFSKAMGNDLSSPRPLVPLCATLEGNF